MRRFSFPFWIPVICLIALSVTPCCASSWPNSIFDGVDPKIAVEVRAHEDLVSQAFTYLQPCPVPDDDGTCLNNQRDFVLDYIYSFYNDHAAQRNLAYSLSDDGAVPGIMPSPIWACAWRIAIIASGGTEFMNNDLEEYKEACQSNLSLEDQNGANAIAYGAILMKIHDLLAAGSAPVDLIN